MAQPAVHQPLLSIEEYLELEEASPTKHEYVAGLIHAMTGTTKRHNQIALNIALRLMSAAAGGACRIYAIDVKVRVPGDVIYYPDVMVACGPEGGDPRIEDAPCLIVEVISPSTAAVDRREKAAAYRRIDSLRAYLLVEQDRRRVEWYMRDDEGTWWKAELAGQGDVPLPCPETSLSLDDIYAGIRIFEEAQDEES